MRPRTSVRAAAGGVAVAGVAAALAVGVPPAGAATAADTVTLKPTGSVVVTYRGNGHGHGLSQYGAYGAALAGLTTWKVLAHYYPGTAVATVGGSLRVKLSGTGSTLTVYPAANLHVTGISAALPTAGIARYRLVADAGSTITLQRLTTAEGATWTTVKTKLANNTQFTRPNRAQIRVARTDRTSTYYLGYLRAVRLSAKGASAGLATVNIVGLNSYVAGVVPREMPASWSIPATSAQAVAARSYAVYERAHASSYYDICDTSSCQVYGGLQHLTKSGSVAWDDYPAAAIRTLNKVLTYKGAVIFAQYSASNGGWSTSGGQPYLKAAADKYDPGKSGDPYVNATRTVKVAALASYAGLAKATKLVITKRDGHSLWGGRVLTATLTGTTSAGKAATKALTGSDLQSALGLGTTWLTVKSA